MDAHDLAAGGAEEHVVVAAAISGHRPLVSQIGDQPALLGVLAGEPPKVRPLRGVHHQVVLGEAEEVEAGVVATIAEVHLGRSLALREVGVAMGLTPVDPVRRVVPDPDRVGEAYDRIVLGADLETVHPGGCRW